MLSGSAITWQAETLSTVALLHGGQLQEEAGGVSPLEGHHGLHGGCAQMRTSAFLREPSNLSFLLYGMTTKTVR